MVKVQPAEQTEESTRHRTEVLGCPESREKWTKLEGTSNRDLRPEKQLNNSSNAKNVSSPFVDEVSFRPGGSNLASLVGTNSHEIPQKSERVPIESRMLLGGTFDEVSMFLGSLSSPDQGGGLQVQNGFADHQCKEEWPLALAGLYQTKGNLRKSNLAKPLTV